MANTRIHVITLIFRLSFCLDTCDLTKYPMLIGPNDASFDLEITCADFYGTKILVGARTRSPDLIDSATQPTGSEDYVPLIYEIDDPELDEGVKFRYKFLLTHTFLIPTHVNNIKFCVYNRFATEAAMVSEDYFALWTFNTNTHATLKNVIFYNPNDSLYYN